MTLAARKMTLSELELVDYFHRSSPEYLDALGVDPTRLPTRDNWIESFVHECSCPPERRRRFCVIWLSDGHPVGFSSCDKILLGKRVHMQLHLFAAQRRNQGVDTECVKQTANLCFKWLRLKTLFSEPNAFNVGPN